METNPSQSVWPQNLRRLNLNLSHQRLILFNIIIFIWALPQIITYSAVLNNQIDSTISSSAARWYLSYFIIVLIASCLTMLSRVKRFVFIGFIYFSSAIIHIIATYYGIHDQCNSDKWCLLSLVSSNSLSIILPFILFIDFIFIAMSNPITRIISYLSAILFASISYSIYLSNITRPITHGFDTFEKIGYAAWWVVFISSFSMIIFVIFRDFISNKLIPVLNVFFISEISLVIGCALTFLNSQLSTSSTIFNNYEAWILLLSLSICTAYQLECILHQPTNDYNNNSLKQPLLTDNKLNLDEKKSDDVPINALITKDYISKMHDKSYMFSLNTRPQRLVIYNLIVFIWAVVWLAKYIEMYTDDLYLSSHDKTQLKLQISGVSIMLCASFMGIEREWFGLYDIEIDAINMIWFIGMVLQWVSISFPIRDCKADQKCKNYYVGLYFLQMLLPILIMCDTGLDQLYSNIDRRVKMNSLYIGLKGLMVYLSFDYENGDIKSYQQVYKIGYLLLAIQFVVMLFYSLCCEGLKRVSKLIMASIILIGVAMAWDYHDWEYEFLLLIPWCCLLAVDVLMM